MESYSPLLSWRERCPGRGSMSDKERLVVCAQKHRLSAFYCLRNKVI